MRENVKARTPRRRGNAPTLKDVADLAGVSSMTVSRVINKDSAVREETRKRVDRAIKALRYAPNSAAQVLARAGQTKLALLYTNPSNTYLSEVLVGALTGARQRNVQLLVESCHDQEPFSTLSKRLVESRVDGVILPFPFFDVPDIVTPLHDVDMPTATFVSGTPLSGSFEAIIDDRQAAFDMTRHLLCLGHRRIGFIVGNPNYPGSGRRLDGYRCALRESGVADDPDLIVGGDFSYRSGLFAAQTLLDLQHRPTAIFASNDDMAAAVIAAGHRRHLMIPEDLSVCGFDDTSLATTIFPELTTVRQPIAEMAMATVEMLAEAVRQRRRKEPVEPRTQTFSHTIAHRASVGPAAANRNVDNG
ncbi:LacI family DNA-binding transcriptional regulator [Roseospira visakhapatnamensis]|uniref:LacI family transcriptional regulator n=1 Tax=Roseospira visakhapatnamensis TaxID=390880 RepID=A0A7W6RG46_9PROT|nr:LacI family DNA-binding transcriptional regulator [Roseospira visakhapatnamensis]MBB4267954.1 LacI family transcriptional regulator [Roseospira visakhapatnamensis]